MILLIKYLYIQSPLDHPLCVVYSISVLSVLENKLEVWLIVFKTSSFSIISAHERLFVDLVGGIGCVSREKYSEISVQEVGGECPWDHHL